MLSASTETQRLITANWQRVHDDVCKAMHDAGREPSSIQVIGVAKYVDVDLTTQLFNAGCTAIAENRPQNLWAKSEAFTANHRTASWHLIGHLQRNKVKRSLPHIDWLHSLDSLRLAEAISNEAVQLGRSIKVLLEVNVTQDATKTGLPKRELQHVAEQVAGLPNIELRGLMAMCSRDSGGDWARREFAEVRELRDALQLQLGERVRLDQLSMGMSGDYREAIHEGSTMLRIGSSLFAGVL